MPPTPGSSETSDGLLAGKVIVITGASTGIGAAAARLFAREGATLVLGARSADRLGSLVDELRADGARAAFSAGDISIAADARRLIDTAIREFGRLNGAFNNAGITQYGKLLDIPEEDFDRLMAVNVKGVWLSMREEQRAISETAGAGSIVNTTSVAGYRGSTGIGAYPASKHAVVGLTRTGARDAGPLRIRVNSVAPGGTETPIMVDWRVRDPEAVAARVRAIPFGRMNTPDEVASAAAWLLSDRSIPITGVILPIDGGSSA